jgi:hypothetical protein
VYNVCKWEQSRHKISLGGDVTSAVGLQRRDYTLWSVPLYLVFYQPGLFHPGLEECRNQMENSVVGRQLTMAYLTSGISKEFSSYNFITYIMYIIVL